MNNNSNKKIKKKYSKKYTKKLVKKKTNKSLIYDIAIIGGGISGLYTMYKLQKKYPSLKIILLESSKYYGGRIYTYKKFINNQEYTMDLGAGRLGHHHKLIKELLNELNLTKNIINIPNTKDYIEVNKTTQKTIVNSKIRSKIMNFLERFIKSNFVRSLSRSHIQKFYFYDFLSKYLPHWYINNLENVFEYDSDLYYFNAYDAINYFKYDYQVSAKFFTLKGGLSTIINELIPQQ